MCARGYRFQATDSSCQPCQVGEYKAVVGNEPACTVCAANLTTFGTASVTEESCIQEAREENATSTELTVPSVSFRFSLVDLPAGEDQAMLREQLIATFLASLSTTTRIDPSAIEIDFGAATGGRRLLDLSEIRITIKTRSVDEANTAASDLAPGSEIRRTRSCIYIYNYIYTYIYIHRI